MPVVGGVPDMLSFLSQTSRVASAKTALETASSEVSTGRHSDIGRATGGDLAPLASVIRSIEIGTARRSAMAEISSRLEQAQTSLAAVGGTVERTAAQLLSDAHTPATAVAAPDRARTAFSDVVAVFNGQSGGRYLFAGTMAETRPLSPGNDMLAALSADLDAAPPGTDRDDFIAAWFLDAGGGFEAGHSFSGAVPDIAIDVSGRTVSATPPTPADPAVRVLLADLAGAALAGSLPALERDVAIATAAEKLLSHATGLVDLRATIGATEERISTASAAAEAELSALLQLRNDMELVDPYEAATRLGESTARLEHLFAVTARLSGLSLTEYLR